MTSQSFQYSFTTSQQLNEVFHFLLNPRNWWTGLFGETIEGATNKVNDVFTFYAGNGIHFSKQRLTELNQNKNITWEVTESKLSFLKNPSEWTGSTIRFDMEQMNNETKITFSHLGLIPSIECFEQCSSAWIQYLQNLEQQLKKKINTQLMEHINHRVGIKAPIQKVYEALSTIKGISDWWTQHTTGTSEVGKIIEAKFHSSEGKEIGCMNMEVITLETDKKVEWKFIVGPEEWIETNVTFNLYQDGDYTIVLFKHSKWKEEIEFKAHCSMKWAVFMLSLKKLVETGKGKPSPNDIKIDNWN